MIYEHKFRVMPGDMYSIHHSVTTLKWVTALMLWHTHTHTHTHKQKANTHQTQASCKYTDILAYLSYTQIKICSSELVNSYTFPHTESKHFVDRITATYLGQSLQDFAITTPWLSD